MTVKELLKVLKGYREIRIVYGGNAFSIDTGAEIFVDAFGDYVVASLETGQLHGGECAEICIACTPLKS